MRARIAVLLICCAVSPAFAKSIWVVQGVGNTVLAACQAVSWWPDVVFHNRTAADATVLPLHVSNLPAGQSQPVFLPMTIHAGTSQKAQCCSGLSFVGNAWVVQFDVPDTLGVEGRMDLFGPFNSCSLGLPVPASTKLRMPVFTRLVPAGEEQVHYGTDLGFPEVRLNAGIYNAGSDWAGATISVVQPGCPARTLTQRAAIPPDTFVQVGLPRVPSCGGEPQSSTAYTVVTVDRPSLSFVSTLVNGATPGATAAITSGN